MIVKDEQALRQKSVPVASVEEATGILAQLDEELSKTDNGVGLAAIQIGIPKRVGLIKHKGEEIHLINAEVIEKEDEFVYANEGCLSFPGLFEHTTRYHQFIIETDVIRDGKFEREQWYFYHSSDPTEVGNSGLVAIAVQHEMDHFDGNLIIDHNNAAPTPHKKADKVGRNDPCPCGSGKKFKKCCGR